MSKKIDRKILQAEIKQGIRDFYPYFLGFYFLSLAIAVFSKTWRGFFYWPSFHIAIVIFGLLFVSTFKFDRIFARGFSFAGLAKKSLRRLGVQFRRYFTFVRSRLLRLSRRTWLKVLLIAAVMIFAMLKGVGVIDLLVLLYAAVSILFVLDGRWSAAAALLLLASCPVLLILKKDSWAETTAIYAYYFLVITVITQIRELKRNGGSVDKSIDSVAANKKT